MEVFKLKSNIKYANIHSFVVSKYDNSMCLELASGKEILHNRVRCLNGEVRIGLLCIRHTAHQLHTSCWL